MDSEMISMKQKIEDYSRFLVTLLILSFYLYLGMLITVFFNPSELANLVIGLLLVSISIAGAFAWKLRSMQFQYNELENK
ncbi:YrhC family protein [Radiobacillus sp. PE A8.2]|uniref:YrhC family protein n=1 Tax=Radiobacillus sp. PE A8.2 TaxID=3380349 RepID=UPI00388E5EA6